jgi:antitoxin FitA
MATLTIRNLDDRVKQRLRERAAKHGRSMEEEARLLLGEGVGHAREKAGPDGKTSYERIRALVEPLGGIEFTIPLREPSERPVPFEVWDQDTG